MARKYRSRLAKKESQRMIRQSMMLFVLTGAFVAGILIWGIPAVIRMAGFIGELRASNDPILSNDTIPPYAPQLAIPYEATSSSQIDIKGYAEAGTSVKLFNNEKEISATEVNQDSEFLFEDIALESGDNELYVVSIDDAKNESDPSRTAIVSYDNQPPVLEVTEPSEGESFYSFSEQTITVSGTINETADIFVNNRISFANSQGEFNQKVRLEPGENQIIVRAIDPAGNETSETVIVSYSE